MRETFKKFYTVSKKITAAAAMAVAANSASADQITGVVVGIADGDTITVYSGSGRPEKIRLIGIDAPEKSQAFGQNSKRNLSEMIFNQQVTVYYNSKDRYGRILGAVQKDGKDINEAQVKSGMAWAYKTCSKRTNYQVCKPSKEAKEYLDEEAFAKSNGAGLWADPEPTPPWVYRHQY